MLILFEEGFEPLSSIFWKLRQQSFHGGDGGCPLIRVHRFHNPRLWLRKHGFNTRRSTILKGVNVIIYDPGEHFWVVEGSDHTCQPLKLLWLDRVLSHGHDVYSY